MPTHTPTWLAKAARSGLPLQSNVPPPSRLDSAHVRAGALPRPTTITDPSRATARRPTIVLVQPSSSFRQRLLRSRALAPALALGLACGGVAIACDGGSKGDASASSSSTTKVASGRSALTIEIEGAAWATAKPHKDGYKLKAGDAARGKLKVEADRVKLKDAAGALKAKVKKKDDGFKIYNPDDSTALKVKIKGDGYKLKLGDDRELGRVKGSQVELTSGGAVTLEHHDGRWIVRRDGAPEATVNEAVEAGSAVFLGLTELTVEQRVAAMVFHHEFHGAAR